MDTSPNLIRIFDHLPLDVLNLANLYNDDRFFKNKILYTYLPHYTANEQVMLDNICTETNYKLICLSKVPKTNTLNFIKFFAKDIEYTLSNYQHLTNFMYIFQHRFEYKNTREQRLAIILFIKFLFDYNFILISNNDRFILPEPQEVQKKLNIKDPITNWMNENKPENLHMLFKRKREDYTWMGNTSQESYFNQFGYIMKYTEPEVELQRLMSNRNIRSIDKINTSILPISKITKHCTENCWYNLWEEIDIALQTGRIIIYTPVKAHFVLTSIELKFLNYYKKATEFSLYIEQSEKIKRRYKENKLKHNFMKNRLFEYINARSGSLNNLFGL